MVQVALCPSMHYSAESRKESETVSTQQFDPGRYKAEQRQSWDTAAPGWEKWWQIIEAQLQVVSDRLVDLADLRPGQQVLDIATGVGEPAVTAAQRVGL